VSCYICKKEGKIDLVKSKIILNSFFLPHMRWDLAESGWDLAECGWDLAECGRDLAECGWEPCRVWMRSSPVWGWDLAEWLESLAGNVLLKNPN